MGQDNPEKPSSAAHSGLPVMPAERADSVSREEFSTELQQAPAEGCRMHRLTEDLNGSAEVGRTVIIVLAFLSSRSCPASLVFECRQMRPAWWENDGKIAAIVVRKVGRPSRQSPG